MMEIIFLPACVLLALLENFGVRAESCEYEIIGIYRNGEKEWKSCPGGCCATDCCPYDKAGANVEYIVLGSIVLTAVVIGIVVAIICCRRRSRTHGQILNPARQRVTIIGITTTVPYSPMENASEPPHMMAPPTYEEVAGLPAYSDATAEAEQAHPPSVTIAK